MENKMIRESIVCYFHKPVFCLLITLGEGLRFLRQNGIKKDINKFTSRWTRIGRIILMADGPIIALVVLIIWLWCMSTKKASKEEESF